MSVTRFEKHLLFTSAVLLGTLLGYLTCSRGPKLSILSRNYSPTRSWIYFLLPGSMWGRVGSQTKQNVQGQSDRNSNVLLVNDVDSRSITKDQPKDEQSDKSQVPPLHKDMKPRRNTLLRSAWVIIAVVMTIILGAIAVYYWVLFFPILCKKERKYDVMQMSAKP